jgi:hypothetical protein
VRIERYFPPTADARTKLFPARGLQQHQRQTTRRKKPTRGPKGLLETRRPSRA